MALFLPQEGHTSENTCVCERLIFALLSSKRARSAYCTGPFLIDPAKVLLNGLALVGMGTAFAALSQGPRSFPTLRWLLSTLR